MILQLLVGIIVVMGGLAFTYSAAVELGTLLGSIHLSIGLIDLIVGIAIAKRANLPVKLILVMNAVTIAYSTASEIAIYVGSLLPGNAHMDSLLGTIAVIALGLVIIFLVLNMDRNPPIH